MVLLININVKPDNYGGYYVIIFTQDNRGTHTRSSLHHNNIGEATWPAKDIGHQQDIPNDSLSEFEGCPIFLFSLDCF